MDEKITGADLINVVPKEIADTVLALTNGRNGEHWTELVYLAYVGRTTLDSEFDATVPRD